MKALKLRRINPHQLILSQQTKHMLHEQLGAAVVCAPPEMLGQVLLRVVLRGFQLEGFSLSM